jgi:hypothetical protein
MVGLPERICNEYRLDFLEYLLADDRGTFRRIICINYSSRRENIMIMLTESGLSFVGNTPFEKMDDMARDLAECQRLTPIEIGDLLNEAERLYPEKWTQLTSYFPDKLSETLKKYKSVTSAVPIKVRPDHVRFSQLVAVRIFTDRPELQYSILDDAVKNNLGHDEIKVKYAKEYHYTSNQTETIQKELILNGQNLSELTGFSELYRMAIQLLEKMLSLAVGDKRHAIMGAIETLKGIE